jgi:hypothetical protein
VATVLGISWVWFAGGRKADFNAQLGLACVCIVLISPHTLYYDSGIALIAFVVVLSRLGPLNPGLILGVWAAGLLQLLSPSLGISLSFLPLVFILVLAITHLWSPGTKNTEAHPV